MSNGFVLVLLRELREGMQKLREEITDRLSQSNERLEQNAASLARIEADLNEQRKFTRQIALNQSKLEETTAQHIARIESDLQELKEQLRRRTHSY